VTAKHGPGTRSTTAEAAGAWSGRSNTIQRECRVSAAAANAYLRDAIGYPAPTLENTVLSGLRFLPDVHLLPTFNDTCRTFPVLRAVIVDARARAQADLSCRAASEAIAA
jgi:hypothetical protein